MAEMITRAILLSAGKGSRLLPLTENCPKCLLPLSGKTVLEWQLDALYEAGIKEFVIVTGFREDLVRDVIAARGQSHGHARTLFNPFYHVADNLGSVWMARDEFDRDTLLLNGDTLVTPDLVRHVIDNAVIPVTVTIDCKPDYDDDDMKVLHKDGRLIRIGKRLEKNSCNAESIGLLAFREQGRTRFIEMVETMMRGPEGTSQWYLRAIDRMADQDEVGVTSIEGHDWAEIDYPADLETAALLTEAWQTATKTAAS